ncbi:glycoside hydrolase family 30 beta sandwich domain-containing protein [Mucilaginibacter sp.]|uniref:glycoside hydrolase family 30 protein n=1 Tax=Mucilaginibacter sp. TaxID=1882438 RepID=UPI00260D43B9|nr:glycoside hydrolase family 30 beta sandwich domain-containing protein [Mucilaginibacter sp.]
MMLITVTAFSQKTKTADIWLTNADRSALFQQQKPIAFSSKADAGNPTIQVDEKETFQPIDGFGFALTGGSAMHMVRMSAESRAALIKDVFSTEDNSIGVSYLRLTIGASDLNDHVFSYDDLAPGQTDIELKRFNLGPDKNDVIPVMKEILKIDPKIKILGSPWSAPVWMKDNGDTRGGSLKPEYFDVYARYLIKYLLAMKAEGINLDAITIQNEPLHPGNNPSMLMLAEDEGRFIKVFGPKLKAAGLKTKIIAYDHNADRPDYPLAILNDPEAAKYVDGSAFHLYGGKITALTDVHNAHPEKNLYFTEQMVVERGKNNPKLNVANPVSRLFIGATRNWCRNVLEWNLAADPQNKPFTDRGGCPMCQGAVTIDSNKFTRNVAYYAMAHASKFVRPGSVRVGSNDLELLPNVAFKRPDGKKVLIVVNNGTSAQTFNIQNNGKTIIASLNNGAVGTYIWD